MNPSGTVPLYVDLDGTLTRSDMFVESIVALLMSKPLLVFLLPVWLLKGKAHLKREIARRVDLDMTHSPWSEDFCGFLATQHREGRRLVLITASDQKYADAAAAHIGIFDDVAGSDGATNLSGTRKLEHILVECEGGAFDYAGNSSADMPIWPRSKNAYLVNPLPGVIVKAKRSSNVVRVFDPISNLYRIALKAARIHQWLKNLLLFLPLLFAHRIMEGQLFLQTAVAFVSFGLCASAVYLMNDLFDLDHDRKHPTKRYRPLASGAFPLDLAMAVIPALLLASVALGLVLPWDYLIVLAVYFATTLTYSLRLKQIVILDVLVLAALYTIRLLAGGGAAGVPVSYWLLVFSLFFFLSLGMLKRYTEVRTLDAVANSVTGRGYRVEDAELLKQLGTASGYIAVLVLALYINSDQVRIQYDRPEMIWFLCPLLLYWISRTWLLAHRGQMHEDPVLFAIRDRTSHLLIGLSLAILYLAS